MTRAQRWMAGTAAAVGLLVVGLALLLRLLLPSDEQLAAELGARFEKATGIGLRVGGAHWSLRPSPELVLEDLSTAQPQPITVRRIVVQPRLAPLWQRRIAIASVRVEGALLARASVRAFRGRLQDDDAAGAVGGRWTLDERPLERLQLRDLTWIDRRGIALAYDADVDFDAHWRPHEAELSRVDVSPAARLRLEREGGEDRWRTSIDVGGGTWNGRAELRTLAGRWRLSAELAPKDVDIGLLMRSFGRRAPVEGKLSGETAIDSEGANPTELLRSLHTRTRFTVSPASLNGLDLAKAVSSAGISRGGHTPLDTLVGILDTQAGEDGVVLRYSALKARSGVLTASGNATVVNRRLNGEAAVDIVDGVVGVPLKLGGTLDAPEVSLTGAALAGAAVGTAVLPGVGTAIGARIGQQVEQLFGAGASKKPRPAGAPAPR